MYVKKIAKKIKRYAEENNLVISSPQQLIAAIEQLSEMDTEALELLIELNLGFDKFLSSSNNDFVIHTLKGDKVDLDFCFTTHYKKNPLESPLDLEQSIASKYSSPFNGFLVFDFLVLRGHLCDYTSQRYAVVAFERGKIKLETLCDYIPNNEIEAFCNEFYLKNDEYVNNSHPDKIESTKTYLNDKSMWGYYTQR